MIACPLLLASGNSGFHCDVKQDAGYNQVWIDDGWSVCSQFKPDGSCAVAGPRGSDGCIVPDPQKFPRGMLPLAQDLATLGVTLGIYTGVSSRTCGGFQGSLGNEEIDAKCFVSWGVGAVKLDTCNSDCPVVNGCIQNSTSRFQRALNATGKEIYIYIDSGIH